MGKKTASPRQKRTAKSRGKKATTHYKNSGRAAPRYIAVDSDRPGSGNQSVMVYDTKKGEVLGQSAYEVDRKPSAGETLSLDGVNAEYVGH